MAELPAMTKEAFAPLDYSSYSNVAKSISGAGEGIGKALNDYTTFEKSKDKENMRRQAINDIRAKEPELGKVLRDDATVEEIGKGLSQLGTGMIYYEKMKALQAKNPDMTLPDEKQFKTAIFKASPEAAKQLFDGWEKQLKEVEQGQSSAKQIKTFGDLKAANPELTQEELNAKWAGMGGRPTDLGAEGLAISQRMAPTQASLDKKALDKEKLELTKARDKANVTRAFKDEKYKTALLAINAMGKNANLQDAQQALLTLAEKMEADAELRDSSMKGGGGDLREAAQSLKNRFQYGVLNAQTLQDFTSDLLAEVGEKYPGLGGDKPAPAPGAKKTPTGF